jgi:hypothetical protein
LLLLQVIRVPLFVWRRLLFPPIRMTPITLTFSPPRALELLSSANVERFLRVKDAARESAPGCGESDLRRLKRQFKSLKSNFVQFDVKEAFMDGLIEGRPVEREREEGFLTEVQQQVDAANAELRGHKDHNERLRGELAALIDRICACIEEFETRQGAIASELEAAAAAGAGAGAGEGGLPDTPERDAEELAREEEVRGSAGGLR